MQQNKATLLIQQTFKPHALSYSTIVLYSRDHAGVGVAFDRISPSKPASILPFDDMAVMVGKTKPKQIFRLTQNAFNK